MAMRDGTARVARIFQGSLQRKIELLRATIEIDEQGLRRITYFSDESVKSAAMKWSEISRVLAFKEDLSAYDLLCVALTGHDGTMIVDEQMDGFDELIRVLPEHLPGAPLVEDWWTRVIHPPFAANFTTLFAREQH